MAQPGQTPETTCHGKLPYDKRSAETRVNATKEPLRAYPCPFCDHWHVGHQRGSNGYPLR